MFESTNRNKNWDEMTDGYCASPVSTEIARKIIDSCQSKNEVPYVEQFQHKGLVGVIIHYLVMKAVYSGHYNQIIYIFFNMEDLQ